MLQQNSLFFNSVRSLLTVPVPKLRLELDREDDSLLLFRVLHECALGQLAMRYQIESPLRFQIVPRLLEVCHSSRAGRSHCAASLRQRLQQARESRYPWRTKAVSLSLGRRQFRVSAQFLFRFLLLWRLLLDHPAHEDCASDFPHLLREYAERLQDSIVQLRVRALVGALAVPFCPELMPPIVTSSFVPPGCCLMCFRLPFCPSGSPSVADLLPETASTSTDSALISNE